MRFNKVIYLYKLMDGVSSSSRDLAPDVLGIGSLDCQGLGQAVIDDARVHRLPLIAKILSAQLFAPEIKEICFYLKQYPVHDRDIDSHGMLVTSSFRKQLMWDLVENALTRFETLHKKYDERTRSFRKPDDPTKHAYEGEYRSFAGMQSFLPTPDWLVEQDEGVKAERKRGFMGQLIDHEANPEKIYSEMVDWSVEPEHVSRWLRAFETKCTRTVPVYQTVIDLSPREVKVALITGLAGIATMLDDKAEDQKEAACRNMTVTLLGLNDNQGEWTNLLAVKDSQNVISSINLLLPEQDRIILPPLD